MSPPYVDTKDAHRLGRHDGKEVVRGVAAARFYGEVNLTNPAGEDRTVRHRTGLAPALGAGLPLHALWSLHAQLEGARDRTGDGRAARPGLDQAEAAAAAAAARLELAGFGGFPVEPRDRRRTPVPGSRGKVEPGCGLPTSVPATACPPAPVDGKFMRLQGVGHGIRRLPRQGGGFRMAPCDRAGRRGVFFPPPSASAVHPVPFPLPVAPG
jgi:hypothetical protein